MEQRISDAINRAKDIAELRTIEQNIRNKGLLTNDVADFLKQRYVELDRRFVLEKIEVYQRELTEAEAKIVDLLCEYISLERKRGRNASRTIQQVRNRGLIGAAEAAVSHKEPTEGFRKLEQADRIDLSYESIVVEHPDEFSARAVWFARRTLGLSNERETPPAPSVSAGRVRSDVPISAPDPSPPIDPKGAGGGCYWVFVCNPRKWAIDRFLESGEEFDTWGLRPSDRDRFAPGQLAVVRVGIDHRSKAELAGREPLAAGIYALCEVVSPVFAGTGATDIYWADGEGRDPGWPTVRIRYLRRYLNAPLTIERLKREAPTLSPLLLNGHQASTFPLSKPDFDRLMTMLGEDFEDIAPHGDHGVGDVEKLRAIEEKYRNAAPEIREVVSRSIERGPIGRLAKKANGFKCQMCEALGDNPIGFLKSNGEPYVEAHHVVPVSKKQVGSLDASNVMTLCANHHRQIHHGRVEVTEDDGHFHIVVDGRPCTIRRTRLVGATPGQ